MPFTHARGLAREMRIRGRLGSIRDTKDKTEAGCRRGTPLEMRRQLMSPSRIWNVTPYLGGWLEEGKSICRGLDATTAWRLKSAVERPDCWF